MNNLLIGKRTLEAEARLASLVARAPDGIFVLDREGRFAEVNDAGCRMSGYLREEILGLDVEALVPTEDVARLRTTLARLREGGAEFGAWSLRRKDGALLPVEVSACALPDGRRQGIVRDITERRRLEADLRRAIQLRDDVLGIVAHDLRNPLNLIMMQSALLERRDGGPERRAQKPVETIRRAASRMNHLIRDLLDITSMEAERLSVETSRLPTAALVADALEAQRPLASAASIDLRLDLARDLPDVLADRDRMLQVFENLLGNAVKFTGPGGRVTLGAAPREGEILFWVSDTGVGISADDLPRVFDRFWQSKENAHRGAGLGLPIVKGIVEAHGGRAWVESAPAKGSTFYFTVPVAPREGVWTEAAVPRNDEGRQSLL